MITVKSNGNEVVSILVGQLKNAADTDRMVRTAATKVLGLMKIRIHQKGLNAENKKIGTYSKGYMKIRTGDFQNSARVSRGKNKGKLKDAGVFTDRTIRLDKNTGVFSGEDKVGKARPKYNRSDDTTVVASLTREMENDEKVISIRTNVYGIGFTNDFNYKKSQWVEQTYNMQGNIFALSPDELQAVDDTVNKFLDDALPQ